MAAYLALREKSTGEIFENKGLIDVDNELCKHIGVAPDPLLWYRSWVNSIGVCLAFGKTFDEVREYFDDPEMLRVINWLDENFVNESTRRV